METERMIAHQEAVVGGTEGGPGPTGVPPTTAAAEMAGARAPSRPDPAVPEKALRRRFGAEYKTRILHEADQATASGQLGALLRREGLSSSHLAAWRKQRDAASLEALAPKRRGRKAAPYSPLVEENKRLTREVVKPRRRPTPRFWTRENTSALPARWSGSSTPTRRCGSVATSSDIQYTPSRNSRPRPRIRSGHGTSRSSSGPRNGSLSTSPSSSISPADRSSAGCSPIVNASTLPSGSFARPRSRSRSAPTSSRSMPTAVRR